MLKQSSTDRTILKLVVYISRKRSKLEEQLSDLLFIDCATPEHGRASQARAGAEELPGAQQSPDKDQDAKRLTHHYRIQLNFLLGFPSDVD